MQSEKQFLEGVAKILLRPLRNKKYGITRASVAKDGHFNSMMLTPNKLMEMKAKTLVRLMLYLCTGTLSEEEFLSICLYGLHLLLEDHVPQMPVAIVESEQSATVLSELFPETLWMAYATAAHLDLERFAPLAGRTVTFYPRTDPGMTHYLLCDELAADLRRHYAIPCAVDATLEDHATDDQRTRHIDLLNFLKEKG